MRAIDLPRGGSVPQIVTTPKRNPVLHLQRGSLVRIDPAAPDGRGPDDTSEILPEGRGGFSDCLADVHFPKVIKFNGYIHANPS